MVVGENLNDNEIIINIDKQPCECYKKYFYREDREIILNFNIELQPFYFYPKINYCPICGKSLRRKGD